MVTRLRSSGHDVILVQPFPEIVRPMTAYLFKSDLDVETGSIPAVSRAYYEARSADVRQRLIAMAEGQNGVEVIDPLPVFCDDQNCYAKRSGVPLYFDSDHPSLAGAGLVAASLKSSILNGRFAQ